MLHLPLIKREINMVLEKKYIIAVIILGILTFGSLALMTVQAGGNPKPATHPNFRGFHTAIVWFEVLESPRELFMVLGSPEKEQGVELRKIMNTMNRYDFLFMVCYNLFFATLFFLLFHVRGEKHATIEKVLLYFGIAVSLCILLGDILENTRLLELTGYKTEADIKLDSLHLLQTYTRIKWFGIFAASLLLAVQYPRSFGMGFIGCAFFLVFIASSIAGALSFMIPGSGFLLEFSANILGLGWLMAIVHGFVLYRSGRALST